MEGEFDPVAAQFVGDRIGQGESFRRDEIKAHRVMGKGRNQRMSCPGMFQITCHRDVQIFDFSLALPDRI